MIDTMTTEQGQVTAVIEDAKLRWTERRLTVRQLIRLIGVPQADIARALGMSRQSFNGRMTGATTLQPWELDGIAAMLGIPSQVLDLDPADAARWVLDHPEMLRNLCFPISTLVAA